MNPIQAQLQKDRFAAANRIEIVEVAPGWAKGRMEAGPDHINSIGLIHGGALFSLAATTFFAACNAEGQMAPGVNMSIACLNPARPGTLWAEAEQVSRSRKLATATVRITDAEGGLIALFQGTAYITAQPYPPADAASKNQSTL